LGLFGINQIIFWEKGYQETLKYKQEFGDVNAPYNYKTPDGFKLGTWQANQKTNYNKGKLDKDRIERLEKIGFVWEPLDQKWEIGYQETLKYKKQFGNANAPYNYKTPDGFKLGSWQNHQLVYNKGKLDKNRSKRLEKIGFIWDKLGQAWETGYLETLKYEEQFESANAPAKYVTLDGFKLGIWQTNQKSAYKKDKLDKDRIERLEKIGFIWDPLDQKWEIGYQETLKYKKQFESANAPKRYPTSGKFKLGFWQTNQKSAYKKGKLDKDRIERLEKIGFVWDELDQAWEMGYQKTLKYKKQFEDTNAPTRYKTSDGFNLGKWQSHQKTAYKKGKLENDRSKRLEKIGFVWGY